MAEMRLIKKETLDETADAIREMTETTGGIAPENFPGKIRSISKGSAPTGTVNITENGTHNVAAAAFAKVDVPVPDGYVKPTLSKTVSANGTEDVTLYKTIQVAVPEKKVIAITTPIKQNGDYKASSMGADGFSEFTVDVPVPDGYFKPTGTKNITQNGTHDVASVASVKVAVPVPDTYLIPDGEVTITQNGVVDVSKYKDANVNVPIPSGYVKPSGTLAVSENGEKDVKNYEKVSVNVPIPSGYVKPSGTLTVNANGTRDVTSYQSVTVDVPVPSGYVKPSGTLAVSENGEKDVKNYEKVSVNVPIPSGYVKPAGSLIITANKENIDVRDKESVTVNVPIPSGYVKPEGTIDITTNGYHNISKYAAALVNIPVAGVELLESVIDGSATGLELLNITKVRSYALAYMADLVSVKMPEVTAIHNHAFYQCPKLAITGLPNFVTDIAEGAFSGCSSLALTSLPSAIEYIENEAFCDCPGIKIQVIPDYVRAIRAKAFKNCTGITTITFKGLPKSIADTAFSGCTALTAINVPWREGTLSGAPWGAENATVNYGYGTESGSSEILAGTWVFNNTIDYMFVDQYESYMEVYFNFTSNGRSFKGIAFEDGYNVVYKASDGGDDIYIYDYSEFTWGGNEEFKTINATGDWSEVSADEHNADMYSDIGAALKTYLNTNATKIGTPTDISETIQEGDYITMMVSEVYTVRVVHPSNLPWCIVTSNENVNYAIITESDLAGCIDIRGVGKGRTEVCLYYEYYDYEQQISGQAKVNFTIAVVS